MAIVIKTYNVGKADCILIDVDGFLLLVDGGYAGTMSDIIKSNDLDDLDGIILTHIDSDHISGILKLIEDDLFRKKLSKNFKTSVTKGVKFSLCKVKGSLTSFTFFYKR